MRPSTRSADHSLRPTQDPSLTAEIALTEVPEHLLRKAKEARARLTGEALPDEAPTESANAPAVVEGAAAPAKATLAPMPADPPAPPPPPENPAVTAALGRAKIPAWVMPVLLFLPVWAFLYVGTNEEPTRVPPVLATGGEVYEAQCASCHGAEGGGGVGPAFSDGAIIETFPDWADHIEWVVKGTEGYQAEGRAIYGADKEVGGSGNLMPAFGEKLSAKDLMAVIFYERIEHGEHEEDLPLAEALYAGFNGGTIELEEFANSTDLIEIRSTLTASEDVSALLESAAAE